MNLLEAFLDLIFPPRCAFCRRLLDREERYLCERCQGVLPWLEGAATEKKGEFFSLCVSPLRYEGDVRESIHRYKFKGISGYAGTYGVLTAQCVRDHLAGRYDLVTWAPLSKKRRRKRGYDQAELLAQAVAQELDCPAAAILCKRRDTPAQSGLKGEAERRANAMGAYECAEPTLAAGKRVLLVDDVVTTGATLSECAKVLLTAGAAEVVCATLAKAR